MTFTAGGGPGASPRSGMGDLERSMMGAMGVGAAEGPAPYTPSATNRFLRLPNGPPGECSARRRPHYHAGPSVGCVENHG